MIIPLKSGSLNKTIPIRDFTVTVDYPTYRQEKEIEAYLIEGSGVEDEGKQKVIYLEYVRKYLQATIKDWSGIKDQSGNEIAFSQNNAEELIYLLTKDMSVGMELYEVISKELSFTADEKKN